MTSLIILSLICISKNPVKISVITLLVALRIFICITVQTGRRWIRVISALLFRGGILIMFMILSRFHPNETSSKINFKNVLTIAIIVSPIGWLRRGSIIRTQRGGSMKIFYQEARTRIVLTLLIIIYFIVFLKILRKEKARIRLILCQEACKLVNCRREKIGNFFKPKRR